MNLNETLLLNYQKIHLSLSCMGLYKDLIDHPPIAALYHFLDEMIQHQDSVIPLVQSYSDIYRQLSESAGHIYWSDDIIDLILKHKNPFTRTLVMNENTRYHDIHQWAPVVIEDLNTLTSVANLESRPIKEDLRRLAIYYGEEWALGTISQLPEWVKLPPEQPSRKPRVAGSYEDVKAQFYEVLKQSRQWSSLYKELTDFHQTHGYGEQTCHSIFKISNHQFVPIVSSHHLSVHDLIDEVGHIQTACQNIESFLAGEQAHNMLLFGARGTGKSSTLTAIAHDYAAKGLISIELSKSDLCHLSDWFDEWATLRQHFMLIVDDLAFDEHDDQYCELKRSLQGSLTKQPANVMLCATTNRRHLIEDIRNQHEHVQFEQDQRDEHLSLVERFGLRLHYQVPKPTDYLDGILKLIQRQAPHLNSVSTEAMVLSARQFAAKKESYSYRTAQQFVLEWLKSHPEDTSHDESWSHTPF